MQPLVHHLLYCLTPVLQGHFSQYKEQRALPLPSLLDSNGTFSELRDDPRSAAALDFGESRRPHSAIQYRKCEEVDLRKELRCRQ